MNVLKVVEALQDEPWSWGTFDCCQFTRRVLIETTGKDFAKGIDTYASERAAAKILIRFGGMPGFLTHILGDPVPRNRLRRGDVCLVEFPAGLSSGICVGQSAAFATQPRGLVFVPMAAVVKGWRV